MEKIMPTTINHQAVGIGIDVSKDKLDLAVRLSNRNYLVSEYANDAKGIKNLCGFLQKQEAAKAAPLIIESTGDYHLRSALMIKQKEYCVKVINPITTKKYQKSSIRNAKTDKIDAKRLADIAFIEQDLPDFKGCIKHIQMRKLASLLSSLEKSRQQLTMSLNRFEEVSKTIELRHTIKHFKKTIIELELQIKDTKKALVDLLPEKQKQIAEKTKGLSEEKLAVIYALIGDKNFENSDQLTAFFGLDIAVRKSGKWVGNAKLSKRGNSYARKTLYHIAWGMKTHNSIFKNCYKDYREKGNKHYNAILMILARKFLRYYFKCSYKCADNI
jgi:transposase